MTRNCKWSEIDSLVYNRVFTDHARKVNIPPPSMASPRSSDLPGPSFSPMQQLALLPRSPSTKTPSTQPPTMCYLSTLVHAVMATCANSATCVQFALDATLKWHAKPTNLSHKARRNKKCHIPSNSITQAIQTSTAIT